MTDIKDRAREYLRGQTRLNGGGLFHCNILNLVLGFAEKETKELKEQADKWLRENTGLKIHSAYVEKKLTNAEEIIKALMKSVPYGAGKMATEAYDKAEQFLKEE